MPYDAAIGFWSYSHDDNKLDGGAILELARLIMEEYNLLSGEPLNLFVDRDSIVWGQEWRDRIDSSLAQTTFFIPIITPRYFTRPECCRELLEFAAKAKSLGVEELLLPIIYVETHGLSADNPDEAVALVARTQHVDWHANRLLDTSSREYRAEVNALARRLLDIARNVAEIQFSREVNVNLEDDEMDGLTDITEKIMTLLPEWLDAVMGEKTNVAQITATWDLHMKQIGKLRSKRAPASAVLATQIRMARELLPLAERTQKDSRIYLVRSVELDPLISALIRLVTEHPSNISLIIPIKDAIEEAMTEIRREDASRKNPDRRLIQNELHKMQHLGRIFQRCFAMMDTKLRAASEGNDIVRRWDTELKTALSKGPGIGDDADAPGGASQGQRPARGALDAAP